MWTSRLAAVAAPRRARARVRSLWLLLAIFDACEALVVRVCEGGSCARNGASTLLEALECLQGRDVEVDSMSCCSVCPSGAVVVKQGETVRRLHVGSNEQAVESASELLALLGGEGAGESASDSLLGALRAKLAGDAAFDSAEWSACIERYSEALASVEAQAVLSDLDLSDCALSPRANLADALSAPAEWESSEWVEGLWGSRLSFTDSCTSYEFGVCADGDVRLVDALVDADDPRRLSGLVESAHGDGSFALAIDDDGRAFRGEIAVDGVDGGAARAWVASRAACDGGGAAAEPPPATRWLVQALLRRSAARAAVGEAGLALADTEAAVQLGGNTPTCWEALADAADAAGCHERAQHAAAQARWLRGEDH